MPLNELKITGPGFSVKARFGGGPMRSMNRLATGTHVRREADYSTAARFHNCKRVRALPIRIVVDGRYHTDLAAISLLSRRKERERERRHVRAKTSDDAAVSPAVYLHFSPVA